MENQNNLDKIFNNQVTPAEYAKKYTQYLSHVLENLDYNSIENVINIFNHARTNGKHIFFIGNGGSAATASHFANDLGVGIRSPNKPFKAISLTDNTAVITALGNDDGYENIFTKQLEILMEPEDVVVAISASGNSPNLVKAIEFANSKNNSTVGLVGFNGGKLKEMCKHVIHVETPNGEYGPVEDIHMILDHLIGTYFYRYIRTQN